MIDPLSGILQSLEAHAVVSSRLVAGGSWALSFQPLPGIKFNSVRRGSCWLSTPGTTPRLLQPGDCFVLRDVPFVLASDPALAPRDAAEVFRAAEDGVARCGEGGTVELLGGRLAMETPGGAGVLGPAPKVTLIAAERALQSGLGFWLEHLDRELREARPGSTSASVSLMQLIFVAAFRTLVEDETGADRWFPALADPRVTRVLAQIQANPAAPWVVDEMAAIAAMSRANFNRVFQKTMGQSPLDYLTQWRVRLASKALRSTRQPLAAIARDVGYDSVSGFTFAFRKVTGQTPARFRSALG
jgi:AraC-like DNA-binding protein